MTLVELCCGTASVSLWALAQARPLTGYMGSKRRWAPLLVEALGVAAPERVILCDAGPWGDLWQTLQQGGPQLRTELARVLEGWDRHPLQDLWRDCVSSGPMPDPILRAAQFLFLQARSAGAIPVWWCPERERWESPTGSRTEIAHQRGGGALALRHRGHAKKPGPAYEATAPTLRGMQHPSTIGRRLRMLERIDWARVEVLRCDVRDVQSVPGSVLYMDPPYADCPRYAALLPRVDVLALGQRWAAEGARVAISEAEPLLLDGWTSMQLPHTKPEYVTASWPIALPVPPAPRQLDLWSAA